MITLAEINKVAEKFSVATETVEKDYIISWILTCFAKSKLREDFIFYGGTAIKRVYFMQHRFSEDVDLLSTKKFSLDYILSELNHFQYARDTTNLDLQIDQNKIISLRDRLQLYVDYSGFDEVVGAPKEVRIDFTMGMDVYGDVVDTPIIKSYSDLVDQNMTLQVMSLNTILANKLGLLFDLTRNEPRDLFDIWFLLRQSKEFDFDVKKIKRIFKSRYGFELSATILLPRLQESSWTQNWELRLSKQVVDLPDIRLVTQELQQGLRSFFG